MVNPHCSECFGPHCKQDCCTIVSSTTMTSSRQLQVQLRPVSHVLGSQSSLEYQVAFPQETYCAKVLLWCPNQKRKDTNHIQGSMASEKESLTLDLSSAPVLSLASLSSERSSSGKGTLQYWKELYVQSSVLTSTSAWEWWKIKE